jgi:sugar O-acyltransferase (sialic acid O-acetyltransferase NeuD family)
MKKTLILVGGGGHCKSVIEAAESAGYSILGVLDMPEEVGKDILSTKVIGTDDDIPSYVDKAEFVITVGFIKNPAIRIKLYNKVKEAGGKFATIVASTAHVSKYATLGEGTVVMHQAFVNAGAKVGHNVILNTFSNIEHDAVIGNQCHISTGTMVNGDCKVGDNCFIGSQSVLANGISVGDDIVVGAGSLVRKSIKEKGIYSGNPAVLKIKAQ